MVIIGTGIDEDEVRIDVGYCRQHCETKKLRPLKREEFDKFLKKYPDMDPIQVFRKHSQLASKLVHKYEVHTYKNGLVA